MKPSVKLAACLIVTLCAAAGFAQLASAQTTSTPNAYVYVINVVANGSGTRELDGFSADSTGALTPLPGSPFWTSSSATQFWTLAHTAHWLFASDENNIYSFSIASNGALTFASSINAEQYANSDEITALFLDHTGSTLYAIEQNVSEGSQGNAILAFQKDSTTGALTYIGSNTDYPNLLTGSREAFIGNNEYAYNTACVNGQVTWYSVHRNSDGTLTRFAIDPTIPSNPNGNYCPWGDAADPTNHLAVAFFLGQSGPTQLGVYTADSSGNLTTNSTYRNMPTSAVGTPNRMSISPAGNLLAVGGGGVQVFHFNGSNPITPYTGRLAWRQTYDLAWDTHNHLYSIGQQAVQAWRITPTGWKQATGSPYPMNGPVALTVLSK